MARRWLNTRDGFLDKDVGTGTVQFFARGWLLRFCSLGAVSFSVAFVVSANELTSTSLTR
jgi:hypothetical protein